MGTRTKTTSLEDDIAQEEALLTDQECEEAVVCAMLNGEAYNADTDNLSPDCFACEHTRAAFLAIGERKKRGEEVDLPNVWATLRQMGDNHVDFPSLRQLALRRPSLDLDVKARCLAELATRRRLSRLGRQLRQGALRMDKELTAIVGQGLERLRHIDQTPLSDVVTLAQAMGQLRQQVAELGQEEPFSPSGFTCVDGNAMLRPGALTVIAAHSSHGKSALALTMAYNAAKRGHGVAYYSLEMDDKELAGRVAASLCDVEPKELLYGVGQRDKVELLSLLDGVMGSERETPVYFDSTAGHTIESLMASIRFMARSKKVKGAVVDYLQILVQTLPRQNGQTEESALGGIVRQLKNLAKQEGIWILLLSQLNRNHGQEEPQESDLRGSGQILETADSCLLLWRPEKAGQRYRGELSAVDTHNTAQLRVAKARSGNDQERHILRFVADRAHFEQPVEPLPTSQDQASPAYPKTFRRGRSQRKDRKGEATRPSAQRPLPSSPELPFPNGGQDTTTD